MTLQQLNTNLRWPGYTPIQQGVASPALLRTLDAAGEYQAWVYCAREDMVVSHVYWRCNAATGSPTADTRIETVATDGTPSGTLWATDTNIVSGTLTVGSILNALTASATISRGQMFAVKVVYNSGTSFEVARAANWRSSLGAVPYDVTNVTGSVVKSSFSHGANLALGSSATSFYPLEIAMPYTASGGGTFNNTNSAARAMRFQLPFPCRAVGSAVPSYSSAGDFSIVLYDDAGAELSSSSTAFDGDARVADSPMMLFFDSPVTLAKATWYRLAMVPASATNCDFRTFTLPSADYRSATFGGTNHHYATRASGTWTDTATNQVPLIDLLIDQLDDGSGVGIGHGNMTGGMQ